MSTANPAVPMISEPCIAFSNGAVRRHKCLIVDGNIVKVFDYVAQHYTSCHVMPPSVQRMMILAAQCPVAIALVAADIELQLALSGARQRKGAELDLADDTLERALDHALSIGSVWHSAQARVAYRSAEQLAEDRFSAAVADANITHEATVAAAAVELKRVQAFDKARAEAAVSDAACYAALDEAERHDEQELARRSNGRIY